ncbi:MAG: methyltransferase domain-containing protein [Candidatus ainarchaeum sp.]|nr:methyltransferase domain-containing protein [Candidatus ainarchaeum sp.]
MKKLEIGSGNKPKEGYLHFDIRKDINVDVVGDAKNLPFENNSFEEVFSRFFLEHLDRKDALKVLSEIFRVLKNNGKLELIVPNLNYFCRLFIDETGQKKQWALNKIYGFENYFEDHHFFGYDFEILSNFLNEIGFANIEKLESEEQYLHVICYKN